MNKFLILALTLIGFSAFGQNGSVDGTAFHTKLTDSTKIVTPAGYGTLAYFSQDTPPTWKIWDNGVKYDLKKFVSASFSIGGASDANVSSPTNNQFFRFKTSDNKWHNDSFVAGTDYQIPLVSGTNIKTVNSNSLLGSGNVAVGDALTSNPLSQFASTTSAQLRATLSDESGTGEALFGGATPSSFVLSNATGLPPTTGISGWPSNSAGVLTNNGAGTLSWGASGGITGTLTSGRIPVASGTTTVTDYSNFTYNGTVLSLGTSVTIKSPDGGGSPNLFFGNTAGVISPSGGYNTGIGFDVLQALTSGSQNTGVGAGVFTLLSSGGQNTAMGYFAMGNNVITGSGNTAIGRTALFNCTSCSNNVAVGDASGNNTSTSTQNVFVGRTAGTVNTASDNTFLGYAAGVVNTSGAQNTFIGSATGSQIITTSDNTFIGYQAALNSTGSKNTFIGSEVLGENNTSGTENNAIGFNAWGEGAFASPHNGNGNNVFGSYSASGINTGNYNIVIGHRTSMSDDAAVEITTGSQNIAMGYRANVPSSTADGQLSIQNAIYGTGNTLNSTGDLVSLGNIGLYTKTPNSKLQVEGSVSMSIAAKTANYTLTNLDYSIEVTSGTNTQTLPTAVAIKGRTYFITNSGSGVVTVATTSSQTFVNVTATPVSLTLNQFNGVLVQSNGANWIKISGF